MQKNHIPFSNASQPCVAELISIDQSHRLVIRFLGYEFPMASGGDDANYYNIELEYHRPWSSYQFKTTAINADTFSGFYNQRLRLKEEIVLIEPPYRIDFELKLKIKKSPIVSQFRRGIKFPKFRPHLDGLFAVGKIGELKFEFKINRSALKKFTDAISQANQLYPARFKKEHRTELNPFKALESKFNGGSLSEEHSNILAKIIEERVTRYFKPIHKALKRFHRRRKRKPTRLSDSEYKVLIDSARNRIRNEVIAKW